MKTKRIEGKAAVEAAKELGIQVQTYADPVDNGGLMDPYSEAVKDKLNADPGLVYLDVDEEKNENMYELRYNDPYGSDFIEEIPGKDLFAVCRQAADDHWETFGGPASPKLLMDHAIVVTEADGGDEIMRVEVNPDHRCEHRDVNIELDAYGQIPELGGITEKDRQVLRYLIGRSVSRPDLENYTDVLPSYTFQQMARSLDLSVSELIESLDRCENWNWYYHRYNEAGDLVPGSLRLFPHPTHFRHTHPDKEYQALIDVCNLCYPSLVNA